MKADVNWTTITLILGVIVTILLVSLTLMTYGNVGSQLGLQLGWVKLTPVEKAILCSYYRCEIGCASAEVSGVFGGRGWCADFPDACNLPPDAYEGEEKKVCGSSSEQWPVEVELKSGEYNTISRDKLKAIMGSECLMKINSGSSLKDQIISFLKRLVFDRSVTTNTIWVSDQLISSYNGKEECLGYSDSYKEINLKDGGKAYISTSPEKVAILEHKLTYVYSHPLYFELKPSESAQIPLPNDEKIYRIVELDNSGKKTGEEYVVLSVQITILEPDYSTRFESQISYQFKVKFSCESKEKEITRTVNVDDPLPYGLLIDMFCTGKYQIGLWKNKETHEPYLEIKRLM